MHGSSSPSALSRVAFGDIGLYRLPYSQHRPFGGSTRVLAHALYMVARGAVCGIVGECALAHLVVGDAKRYVSLTSLMSPAHQPRPAVAAFAVAEVNLCVDALPVQPGRQLRPRVPSRDGRLAEGLRHVFALP